jgi:hypothetical protein
MMLTSRKNMNIKSSSLKVNPEVLKKIRISVMQCTSKSTNIRKYFSPNIRFYVI